MTNEVLNATQQKLVEENINLAHYIVWKYYPGFAWDDEIISSATMGLCKAALTWDESKSKFNTYAGSVIRNEIRRELRNRQRQVETVSIDAPLKEDLIYADVLEDKTEELRIVDYSFLETFTDAERWVYDLRKKGYTVEEIEDITGFDHRKVLRTMRLGRAKYRKYNN